MIVYPTQVTAEKYEELCNLSKDMSNPAQNGHTNIIDEENVTMDGAYTINDINIILAPLPEEDNWFKPENIEKDNFTKLVFQKEQLKFTLYYFLLGWWISLI